VKDKTADRQTLSSFAPERESWKERAMVNTVHQAFINSELLSLSGLLHLS